MFRIYYKPEKRFLDNNEFYIKLWDNHNIRLFIKDNEVKQEDFVIQKCTGLKDNIWKRIFEWDIIEWVLCDRTVHWVCKSINDWAIKCRLVVKNINRYSNLEMETEEFKKLIKPRWNEKQERNVVYYHNIYDLAHNDNWLLASQKYDSIKAIVVWNIFNVDF